MKKTLYIILFIPFALLGQDNVPRYIQPVNLVLLGQVEEVIPNLLYFKPIGWNSDSINANIILKCSDAKEVNASIIVQNTITDEILEQLKINNTEQKGFTDYIEKYNSIVKKYNLKEFRDFNLVKNTLIQDKYEVILNKHSVIDSLYCNRHRYGDYNTIMEYQLIVGNSEIGYKTISKDLIKDCFIKDIVVKGYYYSPNSKRVIIVLNNTRKRLGEIAPSGGLFFIGCSLVESTFK